MRKKILVLERAPEEESGGNSRFTAGLFRLVYNGPEDLKTLIPDLSDGGDRATPTSAPTPKRSSSTTWRG